MRRFALLAVLIVVLPSRAHAQDTDDSTRIVNVSPAVGFHYGQPLRLSIAAGGLFDLNGGRNDGIVAMAEMGQGGGELSIGYFQFLRFGQGADLRLAALRTSADTWNAAPRTTYLGVEAHVMFLVGVGGRIGWLRRASARRSGSGDDTVLSLGASIGM
jgi:hypothetical protein